MTESPGWRSSRSSTMRVRSGKIKEDEQREQIPGEPPQEPVVGNERIVDGFARGPWNDRLRHGAAELVDLSRDDPAGTRVAAAADGRAVAFDDAGDRRVPEDHGEVAVHHLSRLDHDRAEVGSAVIGGLRVGRGRRRAERQRRHRTQDD